ncbi:hypothetical protein [Colwellia marinimaniae]|uniref:Uncharacterized protein n=2 Tax=Colwellia TaxID=28228 RepID=A0ABQ0MS53_9GAMM|nr:hypothetical protein [Colwellia marinimaniae]GAW95032.1 hypothetical protein MTCD1_00631 [Colwellia marinimaniae]
MTAMNLLTCTALISGLVFPLLAQGQTTNLAADIKVCRQISQDQARLTCFDALSQQKLSVSKLASTSVTAGQVALTAEQIDAFAKEQVKKTTEELANEINSISLTISKLTKTPRGKWNIFFENGQKWQQKDTIKFKLKVGQQVILTKGALSAVFLQKENTNTRIKVKRLK